MRRSVVLLSSGLDSTISLYEAMKDSQVELCLTFDYGQRAAPREIEFSQKLCQRLELNHKIIELPWFKDFTMSSLLNTSKNVPTQVDIHDSAITEKSAKAVWVPNRNGIFLNIAAAYAESLNAQWVVCGFNIEEAATFADNSQKFLAATTRALEYSTANHVEAVSFVANWTKSEIVQRGQALGVNFDLIWPCYFAEESPCGICESCLRFENALKQKP